MGRHSAPDDDPDVGLPEQAAPATSVATVPRGRHIREDDSRSRPTPDVSDDGPPGEGLAFLEDAFSEGRVDDEHSDVGIPDDPLAPPAALQAAPDDPTTKIPLADLVRDDRAVPEETTAEIAVATDDPETPQQVAPVGVPSPGPAPAGVLPARGAHATRQDLVLVMSHGDVRARVLAALLVPFVVYVAVLAVVGELRVHSLVWVWAPAITAGVLVGLVLDAGHRRYAITAPEVGATLDTDVVAAPDVAAAPDVVAASDAVGQAARSS